MAEPGALVPEFAQYLYSNFLFVAYAAAMPGLLLAALVGRKRNLSAPSCAARDTAQASSLAKHPFVCRLCRRKHPARGPVSVDVASLTRRADEGRRSRREHRVAA